MNEQMSKENSKFEYGSSVRIKASTPEKFYPKQVGSVCGMDKISIESEAQEFFCEVGDWIYTVELPDGSSIEVPECFLEIDPDRLKFKLNEQVILKKDFSASKDIPEIVSIIDYHKITEKLLVEKFQLELDDFIYVIENQFGQISLVPEFFIEKKYDPNYER